MCDNCDVRLRLTKTLCIPYKTLANLFIPLYNNLRKQIIRGRRVCDKAKRGFNNFREEKKMRATKIICTIGPAVSSRGKIKELIKAGMNVARLNFSHVNYREFRKIISYIKGARQSLKTPVAIMADLQGPKIRMGNIKEPVTVKRGEMIAIGNCRLPIAGYKTIPINIKNLHNFIKRNQRVLINDGMVSLKVTGIDKKKKCVICRVISGGVIEKRKGVNLPGASLPLSAVTKKDKRDLKFALKNGADIISLSFVRLPQDIKQLKTLIKKYFPAKKPLVIAKIEKPSAVKNIAAILKEADGIMIARGDLAVEIGYGKIPQVQKSFIKKANRGGKIAIVATQMLESMINSPYPHRAEITDIYNAVSDGADTLMLSGETSVGKYPLKVMKVMKNIIIKAEKQGRKNKILPEFIKTGHVYENVISYAAAITPQFLDNTEIAVCTHDINDVSYISDYRTKKPVISFTSDESLYYRLAVYSGINPVFTREKDEKKRVKMISQNLKKPGNIVYVDFHGHGSEKGKLIVYKVR